MWYTCRCEPSGMSCCCIHGTLVDRCPSPLPLSRGTLKGQEESLKLVWGVLCCRILVSSTRKPISYINLAKRFLQASAMLAAWGRQ